MKTHYPSLLPQVSMLDTWKGSWESGTLGGEAEIVDLHVGHLEGRRDNGSSCWSSCLTLGVEPSFPSAQHEDPLSQPTWKGGWGNGSSCWTLGHLGRRLE